MRTEKLNVGGKIGTEKVAVECTLRVPETLQEALALAKSEAFAVQMFVRGWRIWNQEQSGARAFVTSATVEQRKAPNFAADVQKIIDNADPNAPARRTGRPNGPKEVALDPKELTNALKNPERLKELLAAQGVKLNIA